LLCNILQRLTWSLGTKTENRYRTLQKERTALVSA
jgi:hypothetical protein